MEIKKPEITDEVTARINKWCQTKLTRSIVPKCFGDPLLRSGLCNPQYPVPKDSTPDVPKPILCGCYHICLIHLAEFLGIKDPADIVYDKLATLCIATINEEDAKTEASSKPVPTEQAPSPQEATETPQVQSEVQSPPIMSNVKGVQTGRVQTATPNQSNTPKEAAPPPQTTQSKEGGMKSPFRRNSKPYLLWEYMAEGSHRSRDEMEKFMIEKGSGQLHYIDKVIARATELGVIEADGDKVRIV